MEEQYNRIIRTEPFTFEDALKIAYQCVKEKKEMLDESDIFNQNLSGDYQLTMLALERLFLRTPDEITNYE